MILIYSPYQSNRLAYTFDFCFKSKNQNYKLTTDIEEFQSFKGIKINYSRQKLQSSFTIFPEGLLQEKNIRPNIDVTYFKKKWLINNTPDIFSVIFFFLSCYEEYYLTDKDKHNRSPAKFSTLYIQNRLHKPNVDIIIKQLWLDLNLNYSKVLEHYSTTLTFDIDSAWAIKNKGIMRSIASDIKDILHLKNIRHKINIRLNKAPDPFDTFSQIEDLAKSHSVICFFLLSDWGKFDKNTLWNHKNLKDLILKLSKKVQLGIHPSYQSYLNKSKIEKELKRLDFITNKSTTKSRQHFLKLSLPKTYTILSDIGITDDYSMGFADAYGFRAGTSFEFPFFNLESNKETELTIHPITYMDGTLNQYLNLSFEESKEIIKALKLEIKAVGGNFCPLWHNETLGENSIWKGWDFNKINGL